jgi:hypothetical protein
MVLNAKVRKGQLIWGSILSKLFRLSRKFDIGHPLFKHGQEGQRFAKGGLQFLGC